MYYPMMMYPQQNPNSQIPMPMPMPMPVAQEGDKNNPQPMIMMMPVCVFDPSKMPKDMKMPNIPYPIFPYPMNFPQNKE